VTVAIHADDPTAPHVADLLAFHLAELRGHMAAFAFALDAADWPGRGSPSGPHGAVRNWPVSSRSGRQATAAAN
jgi:hypothetical protein